MNTSWLAIATLLISWPLATLAIHEDDLLVDNVPDRDHHLIRQDRLHNQFLDAQMSPKPQESLVEPVDHGIEVKPSDSQTRPTEGDERLMLMVKRATDVQATLPNEDKHPIMPNAAALKSKTNTDNSANEEETSMTMMHSKRHGRKRQSKPKSVPVNTVAQPANPIQMAADSPAQSTSSHNHNQAHGDMVEDPLAKRGRLDSPLDLIDLPNGPALNFCPDGVRVRKEFRDLSRSEWQRFKDALKKLYDNKDRRGRSVIDRITRIHLDFADVSHWTAHFLPWHRIFVWLFETELRKVDSGVTVPYWDWSYDARNPMDSEFFEDFYLGLRRGRGGDCNWRVREHSEHCVVRNYNRIGGFYSRATVDRLINNRGSSFQDFAERFEAGPHGIVHTELGGRGGDMTDLTSPNDPAFWLHHSFVEKVFYEWQTVRGRSDEFGGMHRGRRAAKDDWLRPFKIRVSDALDHDKFCYTYQPFSRRVAGLQSKSNSTLLDDGPRVPIAHVPEEWVKMHGMDVERVRALEAEMMGWEAEDEKAAEMARSKLTAPPPIKDGSSNSRLAWIIGGIVVFLVLVALTIYFYKNL